MCHLIVSSEQAARAVQTGRDPQEAGRSDLPNFSGATAGTGEVQQTHQENGRLPEHLAEGWTVLFMT